LLLISVEGLKKPGYWAKKGVFIGVKVSKCLQKAEKQLKIRVYTAMNIYSFRF